MFPIRRSMLSETATSLRAISTLEQVSQRLVHNMTTNPAAPTYLCMAIAGGGGHAISALASTPGASALLLEGTVTYDRRSLQTYVDRKELMNHKVVSKETAILMSRAAVRRAMQYRSNLKDYPYCVGLGVTSALVTTNERLGRGSFGYICATSADGSEWSCRVELAPQIRNRTEEDRLIGQLALEAIEKLNSKGTTKFTINEEQDTIEEESFIDSTLSHEDQVFAAAQNILDGTSDAVLLLPSQDKSHFMIMIDPVLPCSSLIFPGSFNPPHAGHVALARVAAASFSEQPTPVFMELSLTNPDKPNMDPKSVSKRAHKFLELEDLPSDWAILLTSAPLFSRKVQILKPFMAPAIAEVGQRVGFVIGTDTMVRILDPKYYSDDEENMFEAVREMGRSGVQFVVGGRLEQGKPSFSKDENPKFVSGHQELEALPKDVQNMFSLVSEEEFRTDISSSEIRGAAAAAMSCSQHEK